MMIAIEVMAANALWLPTLITATAIARIPVTSAGTIGTLRCPETRAIADPNGSWLSRAIENIIRIVAVWTARQHTKMAIAQSARKMFPLVFPNADFIR